MLNLNQTDRLKEIIEIATKLGWIKDSMLSEHLLMQLPDIEKCMAAMVDNVELFRFREWEKDPNKPLGCVPLDTLKKYNKEREEELAITIEAQDKKT